MFIPAFNAVSKEIALSLMALPHAASSELLSEAVREGGPEDVYVRRSAIHGLGVFARRTFATGETILLRNERPVTPDQPLDASLGEFNHHCDWLAGGAQVYLGYPARHINHSCEPNAFLRRQDGITHVVALRPIRPNEEIVRHYAVNLAGRPSLQCNCGSAGCIGTVPGDFFSLPHEVQLELSPFLAGWFIFEHREEYRRFLQEAGLSEDDLR